MRFRVAYVLVGLPALGYAVFSWLWYRIPLDNDNRRRVSSR